MSKISNRLNKNKCKCADYILNDPYWKKFAKDSAESNAQTNIDQNVNHPSHYKAANGMEAIDVIEAFNLDCDFCLGNCAKYLLRLGKKDNILQDAKKCKWYLDRFIQKLESSQSNEPMQKTVAKVTTIHTQFEIPSDYRI